MPTKVTRAASKRIGITLGDPSGVGPEIVARVLAECSDDIASRIVVFGDPSHLTRASAAFDRDRVAFVDCGGATANEVTPGVVTPAAARASIAMLERAIEAARDERIGALVTAPIHKASARDAGLSFMGHTDMLAERLGAERVAMMFAGPRLRVVLATTHVPLDRVAATLTIDAVTAAIELGVEALRRDFAVAAPRVGVLGLNPHAGEGGVLGCEELEVIEPAMAACRQRFAAAGVPVSLQGPLVPDAAYRSDCDLFVAMYHDQALIPVKLIDFEDSVNVTLGLPIVRTSPDHGTAHDIAGTGVARISSMRAALRLADEMLAARATCSP